MNVNICDGDLIKVDRSQTYKAPSTAQGQWISANKTERISFMKKLSKKVFGNINKGNGIKTYVVMVVLFFILAILSYANIIPWFVKYILLGAFALYLLKGYFEMHKNDEDLLD